MQSKTAALQDEINNLDYQIQNGVNEDGSRASDAQLNLMEMTRTEKRKELDTTLAEEASQQERVQAQEEEIQSITLPFDFDELFSEEDHPVTNANEMIIEVVKDVKRQANIEKNQAIDELKAEHQVKWKMAGEHENQLQQEIKEIQLKHIEEINLREEAERKLNQANIERDDAFSKRDAAFRQLQEAQETIRSLEIKLESAPTSKQALDISPSDKLAQMVKESLADKVNRGLTRWNIPVLETPIIEPVTEVVEPVTEIPFQTETEVHSAESGLVDQSQSVPGEGLEEKSEVITLESLHEYVKNEFKDVWTHIHLGLIGGKKEDAA